MVSIALLLGLIGGPEVKTGITYKTVADKPVLMDFYRPEKPVRDPVPVVVMIHGGSWMSGKREDMSPVALLLANKGVAVANIDYRLAPKDKWPAMIVDCRDAVRHLIGQANAYGIDPDRIGAIGASAGAHLSLLLGANGGTERQSGPNTQVRAVVNLFAPTDANNDFDKGIAGFLCTQVLGKKIDEAQVEIRSFNPIDQYVETSAPVFTLHGTADTTVPVNQAKRLDQKLTDLKIDHETEIVEGMTHGLKTKDSAVDAKINGALNRALDWLVAKLCK